MTDPMPSAFRSRLNGQVSYGDPINWLTPKEWEPVHILTEDELAAVWDEGREAGRINEHEHRPGRKMTNPYRSEP